MIQKNYHSHTYRCNHASGTDEEYILAAIERGFHTIGFSDHIGYSELDEPVRMKYSQLEEYRTSILKLKEKYVDKITIYCGLEVEYFPSQKEILFNLRDQYDYFILGQHELEYLGDSSYHLKTEEGLEIYISRIEEAVSLGLVDYLAHPDICLSRYPILDSKVKEVAHRFAVLSLSHNIPIELNCGSGIFSGIKHFEDGDRFRYPTRAFFEVFAERHCPILIGLDAHDPKRYLNQKPVDVALSIVEGLDLNFQQDFPLIETAKERIKEFKKKES